jgi:hypothetical protein
LHVKETFGESATRDMKAMELEKGKEKPGGNENMAKLHCKVTRRTSPSLDETVANIKSMQTHAV